MAKLAFEDMKFREEDDRVKAVFMHYYHFYIDKSELESIGDYNVEKEFIEVDVSEKTAHNKFNRILRRGMNELVSVLGKPTVYVHRDSGIPLLGTNEFGIVDRGSNILEVKAHTLCNLDCIYCSVDAGKSSGKGTDFLVEEEYMVEELGKIASLKENPVEVQINPQGEPLMYSKIVDLVRDIKVLEGVKTVSTNTNGVLLTEKLVDKLVEAGMDRFNISLNTVNQDTASELAGNFYLVDKVKDIMRYCDGKAEVLIAPLIVPTYNEGEIAELLEFCLSLDNVPRFGFQNFLNYKRGRNPVKSKGMEWFIDMLRRYEKEYDVKLINSPEDFDILDDKKIVKPFRKKDVVKAKIVSSGKYPNQSLGVAEGRCIMIMEKLSIGSEVNVKIIRGKHNIFQAVPV